MTDWGRAAARIVTGLLAATALLVLVAGLPWALCRYIGWPLPDHVPSLSELKSQLLASFSPSMLLDILACACWLTWAVFVTDVACCAFVAARGVRLRTGGPVRRAAGSLVAAILLAVVGSRAATASTATGTQPATVTSTISATATPTTGSGTVTVTETVRPPHDGVHDSLWRVAERIWSDGARWPELFTQNRGVIQPDGQALTVPNHVRPGWRLTAQVPAPPAPTPSPPPTADPPAPPQSTRAAPTKPPELPAEASGIDLATGGFVSLALAAAIGTVVTTLQLRRRRRYRVGSGDRADLQPAGPTVRALLISPPALPDSPATLKTPLGERDGRQHAIDLAAARGLGLTGPGSLSTARALLLHLLAIPRRDTAATVVIPKTTLAALLPDRQATSTPPNLVVAETIDTALDLWEAVLTTRTNGLRVLLATPTPQTQTRLRTVLDADGEQGLAAVLLGPWPPGATLHIDANGTVEAASPTGDVVGIRLYSLPDNDTAELLDLLHQASQHERPAQDSVNSEEQQKEPPPQQRRPSTQTKPLDLYLLGRIRLFHNGADITDSMTRKQREVLAHLALHPDGVRRDTIVADVWPNIPGPRPQNSFHATLSQLRRALRTATANTVENITISEDGHYTLDPAVVDVDLWRLRHMLQNEQDATTLTSIYCGELAEELRAEWLITPRETLRRDVLDGLSSLMKAGGIKPEARLEILEQMRLLDPYNESVYRDIIRAQRELGREESIPRTIALLTASLAEIGESPTSETTSLSQVV